MDIGNFFTMQVPVQGKKDTTVNVPGGVSGTPGLNFLDFIIAQLAENPDIKKEKPQLLSSDNPVLDPDLTSAEILAVDDGVREDMKGWPLDENSLFWQTLALNQKSLDAAIGPATGGIITSANVEGGSPRLLQALLIETQNKNAATEPGKLQAILDKLESLAASPGTGGLAITNLTPEQITDLKAKVEALLNEDVSAAMTGEQKKKALDGIYLGLVALLAPSQQTGATALQTSANRNQAELDAKINNLTSPAKGQQQSQAPAAPAPVQNDSGEGGDQFANLLKDFSPQKNIAPENIPDNAPGVKPDLSALIGWPFGMAGSIFAPAQSPMTFDQYGAPAGSSFGITGLGTLTNLVTQAHRAAQPHPATQAVAATISKAAANGETRNITLQLEPPELGRVEVRMAFNKDKSAKTVLIVEKPETLAMLQRDAHALERALADAGLDGGGSSLGFELAHEGYEFNHRGHQGSGGYASNDAGAEEVIESTMTWHVDPETGHMRYSILA